ncbi:MAG: M23 family metallopeptidase [Rikenellaceae bacterium]
MNKRRENKARKSRIAQLRARKNLRRRLTKVALHLAMWSCVTVIYYFVVSFFFDTPYERHLKDSSTRLRGEYEFLLSRYDSLEMVIENLEARDHNIFNIMFESSPRDIEAGNIDNSIQIHDATAKMSHSELLAELELRSEQFTQSVDSLVGSTNKMVEDIEALGKKSANIPAIQPIANRQLTQLTASFGERMHPFYKTTKHHSGVDYTIPEGRRVFATADGVIKSYSLESAPSGKSITIDHGNGYETYYAHLSLIDIPKSRRVKRGDIIGLSGNSGLSLTPHLHYEVRYNGVAIDPTNFFFMELSPTESKRLAAIAEQGMQAFD